MFAVTIVNRTTLNVSMRNIQAIDFADAESKIAEIYKDSNDYARVVSPLLVRELANVLAFCTPFYG